jgi:hypothetical protein
MATITVPDYFFSAFYYPEIYESLLAYTRINAPELTSESEYEPHIQLLRAFALVGHLNNTRVDVIANEQLVDSIQLVESLRKLFKLIGYELKSATPATAEQLILLSTIPTSDITEYIASGTRVTTEQEVGEQVIFETLQSYAMDRGDQVSHVYYTSVQQAQIDGVVSTAYPTRLTSALGTFTTADVGRTVFIGNSANGNAGEYLITSRVDANTIEVAGASFVSETALPWVIYEYSADQASKANNAIDTFTIFTANGVGNALYVSHDTNQWSQLDLTVTTLATDIVGVWEYYDPTYSRQNPNSVTDLTGTIRFQVNSLLTPDDSSSWPDRAGSLVKVTYNPTGRSEEIVSVYDGTYGNIVTSRGIFGQTSVDTDLTNYAIETDWTPLPNQVDGTSDLGADGTVTYALPMSTLRRWAQSTQNTYTGYWLRFRPSITGTPSVYPTINRIQIDQDDQYFPFVVTQGQTITNEILGSSDGQASQQFTTLNNPVFDNSYSLEVDETGGGTFTAWSEVESFVSSTSTDRHYKAELDNEDRLLVTFGNGSKGKIPPTGTDNIRMDYRTGGDLDGNVGAGQITGQLDSIQFVSEMINPRPASGWTIKEGGDEESLEAVKEAGPASIRNQERAVSPSDIPRVAVEEYTDDNGSQVVERAYAREEAYGPKTVELVVVGLSGEFLNSEQLDDLEEFYNGDRYSIPEVEGVLLLNSELTAVNYDPKEIDCTYTVIGKGITSQQVVNAINAYLQPTAKKSDGSYAHEFGGKVAVVMLDCAISDISDNITNIIRTLPAADVTLGPTQLPNPGTIIVSVQETE